MLLYFTNFLTWILTTLTFIFYGFIYTKYLKFMTSQNIVIGGLAGAMPPLLGWTAISNTIEPNAYVISSHNNGLDSTTFLGFSHI
jgi:Polyprenyltransferase (cytochrome oxidase assembly factor)